MMTSRIVTVTVTAAALAMSAVALADFTPITFTPSEYDVDRNGECRPGTAQCRFSGACVKRGDRCYNCIQGQNYNEQVGCYSCPVGTTLQQRESDHMWVCR